MPPESAPSPETGVSRSELGAGSLEDTASVPLGAGGDARADGDLAAQLTGKVEAAVSLIRDKTVSPVAKAVRYLIFGLLAAFIGITIAVLFAIFSIRVLTTEVPVFHTRVWASWLIVAGIFWLGGLLLSLKRRPRS